MKPNDSESCAAVCQILTARSLHSDRSWLLAVPMILRPTIPLICTLGLLVLAPPAHAESGMAPLPPTSARVRRPTLPIPSDGALLIESDDISVPVLEVRDAQGVVLEGTLYAVGRATGALFAWVPATPFALGTLEIAFGGPGDPLALEPTSLEVVAPFEPGPPPARSEPSATWQATPVRHACCTTPLGEGGACFFVGHDCTMLVQPGLSTAASQAVLNQYLFRVIRAGAVGHAASSEFRPFENTHQVAFDEPADSYCIEIQALSIATQETHVYADLESCASHDNKQVGRDLEIAPDPNDLALASCFVPPGGYERDWCEINAGACQDSTPDACQLYEHVCDDGPLPDAWQQLRDARDGGAHPGDGSIRGAMDGGPDDHDAEMPTDPVDASFGPSAHAGGCSAGAMRATSAPHLALWPMLAIALLARRLRRRPTT
jgi:hypothetical protein